MTTDGGSVWERGRSDDGPEPAASGDDAPIDETAVDAEGSDEDTVWNRGPSIDEALLAAQQPRRPAPEPVLPPPAPIVVRASRVPPGRRPVAALALAVMVVVTAAIAWMLGVVGDDEVAPAVAGASSSPLAPVATASAPSTGSVATTTVPATTTSSTTTTSSSTTSSTTSTTSTTTSSTTTSSTTTSTTSSSTSATNPTSTITTAGSDTTAVTVGAGPVVAIVGRIAPCKFGSDCLVADFSIASFETPQSEFVCDFGGGERYTFRFDGVSADAACATSAADGAITIEVGGVRSETITR